MDHHTHDFRWWSGLTDYDALKGLDKNKSKLVSEDVNNQTYWFPSYINDIYDLYPV
jgi:hypothetical protein